MAKNEESGGADNPQNRADGRGEKTERNGHNHQTSVKLGGGEGGEAEIEVGATEEGDSVQTQKHKANHKQQQPVGEKRVERQETENNGVVGAKVSQVEVDSSLSLSPGGGFGDSSNIEKVSGRLEVGESVLEVCSLGLC